MFDRIVKYTTNYLNSQISVLVKDIILDGKYIEYISVIGYKRDIDLFRRRFAETGGEEYSNIYIQSIGNLIHSGAKDFEKNYRTDVERIEDSEYYEMAISLKSTDKQAVKFVKGDLSAKELEEQVKDLILRTFKNHDFPIKKEWIDTVYGPDFPGHHINMLHSFSGNTSIRLMKIDKYDAYQLYKKIEEAIKDKRIIIGNGEESQELRAVLNSNNRLDKYIERNANVLKEKMTGNFRPLFDPEEDRYSDNLKDIDEYIKYKGLNLYKEQKNFIEAHSRNLDRNKTTIMIGEMGVGKTILSIGTMYAHSGGRPTVNAVMCPSHLVEKWKEEIDKYYPAAKTYIIDNFDHFKEKEEEIFTESNYSKFMLMSKDSIKNMYTEMPTAIYKERHLEKRKRDLQPRMVTDVFVCPKCNNQICNNDGSKVDHKFFKNKTVRNSTCRSCGEKLWSATSENDRTWIRTRHSGFINTDSVESIIREYEISMSHRDLNKKEQKEYDELIDINSIDKRVTRTYPVAKYIKKYYKHKIDYLIADEVHQYEGKDSLQANAFGDLVDSAKKVMCLTGTLLNGYASSLFYLFYKLYPSLMLEKGYKFHDHNKFALDFGVHKEEEDFNTRTRKSRKVSKFHPGVSPKIFTEFVLERAGFITLSELSDNLPSYEEIPMEIDLNREVEENYKEIEDAFIQNKLDGQNITSNDFIRLMSIYPDMPYNNRDITYYNKVTDQNELVYRPKEVKGIPIKSKDVKLLKLIKKKIRDGEKVLVYYNWTNITDTAENISNILKKNDIKHSVLLSSTVNSRRREEWIQNQVEKNDIDVLICNPKLVETGLDLLDFTTIVFYNIAHDIFTVRQSSRRSWRLSQKKPKIEVYFMYYKDTVQEQWLGLMADKFKAAQVAEGRFSEDGLEAMSRFEDVTTQLANNIANKIKPVIEKSSFGNSVGFNIVSLLEDNEEEKNTVIELDDDTKVIKTSDIKQYIYKEKLITNNEALEYFHEIGA